MRRSLLEDQRAQRRSGSKLLLSLLAVLAAGVTLAGVQGMLRQGEAGSPLLHDVKAVWQWVVPDAQGGSGDVAWSFRWDARQPVTGEQAERLALLLDAKEADDAEGGSILQRVWRSDMQREEGTGGGRLAIWHHLDAQPQETGSRVAEAEDGNGEEGVRQAAEDAMQHSEEPTGGLVVLLESMEGADYEEVAPWLARIEQSLEHSGLQAAPSFSFRAATGPEAAERLAEAAGATLLERYSDRSTVSDTYYSSKLRLSAQSGQHKVNLQLALLLGSTEGEYRLTGGVPLITGEYLR